MEKLMSILNSDRKLKFLFWLAALWHDCVQLTKAIFKGMSRRCRLQQFISTRKVFHVNITFLLEVDVPQSWLMNINAEGRKLRAAPRKPCIVFLMAKITNSIAHWIGTYAQWQGRRCKTHDVHTQVIMTCSLMLCFHKKSTTVIAYWGFVT